MSAFATKYRSAYFLAILATLLLVGSTQVFIQRSLEEKSADAYLINISGRQRMLSQRILQQVFQCHLPTTMNCDQASITQLFEEWRNTNRFIVNHPNVRTEVEQSLDLRVMLAELQERINTANALTRHAATLNEDELALLHDNQMTFLSTMDKVVRQLEEASSAKLERLAFIEMMLALLTILVIALEVMLIFRPIIQRLIAQNAALQTSQQLIKQYTYVASSDLRQPIRNIVKSILQLRPSLSQKGVSLPDRTSLEAIEQNALKAQAISRDLVTYTEVMTKAPDIKTVDFWELLNGLVQRMEEHIHQVRGTVNIGNIPRKVKVDNKQFQLLWQHLLQNALQYHQASVPPQVTITGHQDETHWHFRITDNGRGISPAEQENLFVLFRRVQSPDSTQGTGLGLPLVKQIVARHGGDISIESTVNAGTTIRIEIPRQVTATKLRAIKAVVEANEASTPASKAQ
ncbi:MAG: ATP-binding protein [Bacteroidota bacterium]